MRPFVASTQVFSTRDCITASFNLKEEDFLVIHKNGPLRCRTNIDVQTEWGYKNLDERFRGKLYHRSMLLGWSRR